MTRFTMKKRKEYEEATGFVPFGSNNDSSKENGPMNGDGGATKRRRFQNKKETSHEQETNQKMDKKERERIRRKNRKTQCFACRKFGHSVKECREAKSTTNKCYKCGENHSVSVCRVKTSPDNPYPFAECFVCKQTGHLASACPKNEKGMYPNGGGCEKCGSTRHLRKDCKEGKKEEERKGFSVGIVDSRTGADEDDLHVSLKTSETSLAVPFNSKGLEQKKKQKKIVKF